MIRRVNKGLTIIEVLIVLAVSAGLAVISIGAFSSRGRTQADEAARLMMADIVKVRNDAVQGLGPTTSDGSSKLAGNELFGQAIEFRTDDNYLGETMRVYRLMISGGTTISAYEYYDIPLTQNLKFYIPQTLAGTESQSPCNSFYSCYNPISTTGANLGFQSLGQYEASNRMIVIRNRTGETYTFARSKSNSEFQIKSSTQTATDTAVQAAYNGASNIARYDQFKQGILRIAYGLPGTGTSASDQMSGASYKYYAIFDMKIPNNQEFKVVK
jgi:prepilin-type N-terminal cleavage/methylation domain-containing protein